MPKVKLLRKPHQDCFVHVDSRMWEFRGQEIKDVPKEVVDACLAMKDPKGEPLFECLDAPDADVENILGIQLEYRF